MQTHDQVLIALRQIIRAIDLHSKRLERASGLTGPQLLVMRFVGRDGPVTSGVLARAVSLSPATVTSILDRLERRGLLARTRGVSDKRKVMVSLTDAGRQVLQQAPMLLQESFVEAFSGLQDWEQSLLLSSLQRIAAMMQASELDAAPILDTTDERLDRAEGP